jgi:hypothetical protein
LITQAAATSASPETTTPFTGRKRGSSSERSHTRQSTPIIIPLTPRAVREPLSSPTTTKAAIVPTPSTRFTSRVSVRTVQTVSPIVIIRPSSFFVVKIPRHRPWLSGSWP